MSEKIISIITPIFLLKEFVGHALAKAILFAVTAPLSRLMAMGNKDKSPAVFLGKTWVTQDGEVRLVCISASNIAIRGRSEGPLVIELDDEPTSTESHFEGSLYCEDHGGTIGRVSMDLEPFNQIHVRTISNAQSNYQIDLVFRIAWPEAPKIVIG